MAAPEHLTLDSVVSQSSLQVACELDGEIVMMHIDSGEYFGCDAVGCRIWKLIEEPKTVSDVCDVLIREFDVERQQCERDVLTFLNELLAESLVDNPQSAAA